MKLIEPRSVYILRGNHESKEMNRVYGFQKEVLHKYDMEVLQVQYHSCDGESSKGFISQALSKLFQVFPIAAVLNNQIFIVHGGTILLHILIYIKII